MTSLYYDDEQGEEEEMRPPTGYSQIDTSGGMECREWHDCFFNQVSVPCGFCLSCLLRY
ncbi:hypothetical protein Mapa_010786 [Marchantia paleacea]|nr:hypothetical protein Mapa_010786 [Marchantia paleacea]